MISKQANAVLISVLLIATPVIRYLEYHAKEKKAENDAKQRGTDFSEDERKAIESYRAEKELSLKYVALACAGAFIILLAGSA